MEMERHIVVQKYHNPEYGSDCTSLFVCYNPEIWIGMLQTNKNHCIKPYR